jgi:hypothetical protein
MCVPASATDVIAHLSSAEERSCPARFDTPIVIGDGSQPGCDACSACGAGTCAPGDIEVWENETCSGNEHTIDDPPGDECVDAMTGATTWNADAISGASGLKVEPSTASTDCAPGTSHPLPVAKRNLCTTQSAVLEPCDGGVCVPIGAAGSNTCVVTNGAACPSGLDTVVTVHPFQGDSRSCDCSCTPGTGTCSGAKLVLYDDGACGNSPTTIAANDTCVDVANLNSVSSYELDPGTWTLVSGCDPVLSQEGNVSWASPIDLCCLD